MAIPVVIVADTGMKITKSFVALVANDIPAWHDLPTLVAD